MTPSKRHLTKKYFFTGMSVKSTTNTDESENPLDVLSRAATMVEKSDLKVERSPSFKERHPKFRKSSTPDYMVALETARSLKRQTSLQSDQSESRMDTSPSPNNNAEDLPLDMSIKKRPAASPPPPPPYRSFNPLRSTTPPSSHFRPPPQYNASTPSPPLTRPPPPSYEDSKVTCSYPTKTTPPPKILQEVQAEEKTKIKEITIITSMFFRDFLSLLLVVLTIFCLFQIPQPILCWTSILGDLWVPITSHCSKRRVQHLPGQ